MPVTIIGDCPLFGVPDVLPDLPAGSILVPDPKDFLMIIEAGGRVSYVNKEGLVPHDRGMPLQDIEPPPWTVRMGSSAEALHELHFRWEPQTSIRGTRGRDLLIQLAALCNVRGISPHEFQQIHADCARLDWIERECFEFIWDDTRPGVTRASDGRDFYGSTRREAIDAALEDERS